MFSYITVDLDNLNTYFLFKYINFKIFLKNKIIKKLLTLK